LTFPRGRHRDISSVRALPPNPRLKQSRGKLFSPQGGDWPGEGTLAPSTFLPGEPSPSEMWAAGLYHWIRSGRTKPNVKDLKEMQDVAFNSLGEPGDMTTVYNRQWIQTALAASASEVIQTGILSTLVGTGEDPRLDQFAGGGSQQAQDAYWKMASYDGGPSQLPANAFVVGVDDQGNVFTADGSRRLSESEIHEFWTRVGETNTAGLITMAMANKIKETAQASVADTVRQINDMKAALDRLRNQASDPQVTQSPDKQAEIQAQIDQLTTQIPQLEQSLGTHNAIMEKAEDAYRNGSMAASVTHTMISNQRTLTAQGFTKDGATFLLAGSRFEPHPMPPSSIDAITGDTANSGNLAGTLWTAKSGFYVFEMPTGAKISRRLDSGGFLQPARAESVMPKSAKK